MNKMMLGVAILSLVILASLMAIVLTRSEPESVESPSVEPEISVEAAPADAVTLETESVSTVAPDTALAKGSSVSGIAVDKQGAPVANRDFVMMSSLMEHYEKGGPVDWANTKSDEQGGFMFSNINPGAYVIRTAPVVTASGISALLEVDPSAHVTVESGMDITGLRVVMDLSKEITLGNMEGVVLDTKGDPAPDVTVTATPYGMGGVPGMPRYHYPSVQTNVNGEFSIPNIPNNTMNTICAESILGMATIEKAYQRERITLRLKPAGAIGGVVKDSHGVLMEGCEVAIFQEGVDPFPSYQLLGPVRKTPIKSTMTDASGAFHFAPLDTGSYSVTARSTGQEEGSTGELILEEGRVINNLCILLNEGVSIRGRVKTQTAKPIPDAALSLIPILAREMTPPPVHLPGAPIDVDRMHTPPLAGATKSDARGVFLLQNIQPGAYMLIIQHDEYAPYQKDLEVPEKGLTDYQVILGSGGGLTGVCMVDGKPYPRAMVQLTGGAGGFSAVTDQNGRYEFTGIRSGGYMAQVSPMPGMGAPGDLKTPPKFRQHVVDIVDSETVELNFGDEGGVTVAGTITNVKPGFVVLVYLKRPGGPESGSANLNDMDSIVESARYRVGYTSADAAGAFLMENIEPGQYILEINAYEQTQSMNGRVGFGDNSMQTPPIVISQDITVRDKPLNLELALP